MGELPISENMQKRENVSCCVSAALIRQGSLLHCVSEALIRWGGGGGGPYYIV